MVTKLYDNLRIRLCADCAIQAIEDEADGVYYDECVFCGKTFDYGEECSNLTTMLGNTDISLEDCWGMFDICCADCAVEKLNEEETEYFDDDEDDDGHDSEALDVYDAALIWQSNGMDEDYMFGYTEEELRNAL